MAKISSLRDYLDDYAKRAGVKSFGEFMSLRAADPTQRYAQAVNEAARDSKASLPSYGRAAISLSERGLYGSGYEEYLTDLSKKSFQAAKDTAEEDRNANERKAYASYVNYLEEQKRAAEEKLTSTVGEIIEYKLVNKDNAIDYATRLGYSPEEAEQIADKAYVSARADIYDSMIKRIKGGLGAEEAVELGRELGLRSSELKRLEKYAKEYKEKTDKMSEQVNELIEQAADNKKGFLGF